jgi:hypothetical protein
MASTFLSAWAGAYLSPVAVRCHVVPITSASVLPQIKRQAPYLSRAPKSAAAARQRPRSIQLEVRAARLELPHRNRERRQVARRRQEREGGGRAPSSVFSHYRTPALAAKR